MNDSLQNAGLPVSTAVPRIVLESLHVKRDRIVAVVRVGDASCANTTPELAHAVAAVRPDLPIHACVNGVGPTFGAVIEDTPIPHLLEHLVVDLQTAECPDPNRVFTGATRWTDRRAGIAQVQVSYADDLACIRAFRDAAALLNALPG